MSDANFFLGRNLLVFWFWFLVFGLLCRHTASNPLTSEMHTSGVHWFLFHDHTKIESSGFSFFPAQNIVPTCPDPDMNITRRWPHCKLAKWSMRMPRTSTTTPVGLSLEPTPFKDCPWIQTLTVPPSSQTQPDCMIWRLASCWRKTGVILGTHEAV